MAKGKIVNTTVVRGRFRPENHLRARLWDSSANGTVKKVRDRMGRPVYVPLREWVKR